MKILLIAGHGANDPGACSSYGVEREETRKVVAEMKSQFATYNVNVDIYPTNRNAYADVCNGCLQVNFANYDYIFEVHFNSAVAAAHGTEVWVTYAEVGTTVEQSIVNKLASIGFSNRGVKRENFAVINSAKNRGVSAALVEVCFISNSSDMNIYKQNFNRVCTAMVEGIVQGFGINKKSGYSAPKQQTTSTGVAYRVKKDGKQIGAFNSLDNAKKFAENNKAIVYDKNNNVVVSYVPVAAIEKRYAESGTFYFNTAVTVRTAPTENAKTNTVYYAGESVIYHHVILNKNGFNWIEYARNNGTTGYLKIKDLSNGEGYGYAK